MGGDGAGKCWVARLAKAPGAGLPGAFHGGSEAPPTSGSPRPGGRLGVRAL